MQYELSIHFRSNQDQTKRILFSMVKGLRKINISVVVYGTKQHDTIEYLTCQFASKLSGKPLVSEVLKKTQEKLQKQLHHTNHKSHFSPVNLLQILRRPFLRTPLGCCF